MKIVETLRKADRSVFGVFFLTSSRHSPLMNQYREFTFIASLLLLTSIVFAQQKEYKLLDKTSNADIDKSFILRLDKAPRGLPMLDSLFKPVKGEFKVYRFVATFLGKSYTGQEKEFHDLLLVKTDDSNKVIKAYH